MWRISFLNLDNEEIGQKGGFASGAEADEWAMREERDGKIIALKLLVWSEMLQSFRTVYEYVK